MKKTNKILVIFLTAAAFILSSCEGDKAVTLSDVEGSINAAEEHSGETSKAGPPDDSRAAGTDAPDGNVSNAGTLQEPPDNASAMVYVYVCGKVSAPGVYELKAGSRVSDALDAAGGFEEDADTGRINLARLLTDGEMIYFPAEGEEIPVQALGSQGVSGETAGYAASSGTMQPTGLININTAGAAELTSLPGIGNAKAEAIVKYREQNGLFKSPADIKNVPGIGDALFSGIEELICTD